MDEILSLSDGLLARYLQSRALARADVKAEYEQIEEKFSSIGHLAQIGNIA